MLADVQAISSAPRLRICGRRHLGGIQVRTRDGHAYMTGIAYCGRSWDCPICSARVAVKRAIDVGRVLEGHHAGGGCALFATMTIRHQRDDDLIDTFPVVKQAWMAMIRSRAFRDWSNRWSSAGWVRALEATPGGTVGSPHPHVHAVICLDRAGFTLLELGQCWVQLAGMWAHEVEVIEPRFRPDPIPGTHVEVVDPGNVDRMAHYAAKAGGWDAARELTRQDLKVTRAGAEDRPGSYFDVARLAARGDRQAFARWREYERTVEGARKVTWSRGKRDLRARHGLGKDRSDEELAGQEDVDGDLVTELDPGDACLIARAGHQAMTALLDAAEYDGADGVRLFLVHFKRALGLRGRHRLTRAWGSRQAAMRPG